MQRLLAAIAGLVLAISLAACGGDPEARVTAKGPLVLAAASLQDGLDEAATEWEKQGHPRPTLSFAGTSELARQVIAGAPADLFISADEKWMDDLSAKSMIRPETRTVLLGNGLVLIAPVGSTLALEPKRDFPLAQALGSGRLAMADPETVPAGRYGKEALENLRVWPAVSKRIAVAENVRLALALVARKEAPLGIVYETDARAEPKVRIVARFPKDSHKPIVYPIAVLKASTNVEAVQFRAFLLSDAGQAIFGKFGFQSPPGK